MEKAVDKVRKSMRIIQKLKPKPTKPEKIHAERNSRQNLSGSGKVGLSMKETMTLGGKSKRTNKTNEKVSIGGNEEDLPESPPREDRSPKTKSKSHHAGPRNEARARKNKADCAQHVNTAVQDFFNTAWAICAERFYIESSSVAVSNELRNTWLKIMEMENQDPSMKEASYANSEHVRNKTFIKDQPPLPLAYDTWSNGTLEILPRTKRESVLDPFLRDKFTLQESLPEDEEASGEQGEVSTNDEEERGETPEELEDSVEEDIVDGTAAIGDNTAENESPSKSSDDKKTAEWNFDLDPADELDKVVQGLEEETLSSPEQSASNEIKASNKLSFQRVFFSRTMRELSRMDLDNDAKPFGKFRLSMARKDSVAVNGNFSASQCGAQQGSKRGVFKLFRETTSEALHRGMDSEFNTEGEFREEQEAHNIMPIRVGPSVNEAAEAIVLPLFEETQAIPENNSRPSTAPSSGKEPAPVLSVQETESDTRKEFMKRNVINLRSRIERQVMRNVRVRAKKSIAKPGSRTSSSNGVSVFINKEGQVVDEPEDVTMERAASIFFSINDKENEGDKTSQPKKPTVGKKKPKIVEGSRETKLYCAPTDRHKQIHCTPVVKKDSGVPFHRLFKKSSHTRMGNVRSTYAKERWDMKPVTAEDLTRYETTLPMGGHKLRRRPSDCDTVPDPCDGSLLSQSETRCNAPKRTLINWK